MANEDLIYRITRAVYDRLGSAVDDSTVEQLVTDIYNQVGSTSVADKTAVQLTSTEGSSDRMVISVFGLDHPGIVAGVSQILAEASCSIVDRVDINETLSEEMRDAARRLVQENGRP